MFSLYLTIKTVLFQKGNTRLFDVYVEDSEYKPQLNQLNQLYLNETKSTVF